MGGEAHKEMQVERRRSTGSSRNGVVAGSVWESRMKSDEVKGGIKVFNAEEIPEENGSGARQKPKPSPVGKRKTWKSENSDGLERSPIQIARKRSEQSKTLGEQLKELSTSADGIKRSPVQAKKTRSEVGKELSVSVDKIERNAIQIRKAKSESQKFVGESGDGDGIERSGVQLRKVKSESHKHLPESAPIPLVKSKSVSNKVLDNPGKNLDESGDGTETNSDELKEAVEEIEKNPVGIEKSESDETCKEVGVCEEKSISNGLKDPEEEADWEEELEGEVDEEIENENETEKNSIDVKEVSLPEQKSKQVVEEEKKLDQVPEKPLPISPISKKLATPLVNHSRTPPIPTKTKSIPVSNGFQRAPETDTGIRRIPETHSKLQSLVDLVMWKEVSKSAFVFGIGTFLIISSSYTKDLNISLISVVSYMGLVYLAAIFLFRSIIYKGIIDVNDTCQRYIVGEEEAIWLLKMVLPFLNEFLLKLKALFSGDPATTMKLAVLLFVLARCGNSITIWKMAKLGFFGVFIIPKICSSYSTQLTAYGKFWVRRFQDAWESCSHKKAVALGLFTLVWNLSSVVARIWAVFMLFVAFRYYHQSVMIINDDDAVEEEPKCETSWQGQSAGRRRWNRPPTLETNKEKKRF
ncbi:reticulon-like protein B21 [Diospyros lotus]|uniref:reticulon-like protein B21 n=1 Tax=Diospyros lotus TaxID=55363 RepID=UPI00224ED739|nr:reticulon-like protein B21 [Diospyros lotus]